MTMQKPFAITLDPGSSLANKTGSWRTERPVYAPDHSGQWERCFTHGDREFTEFCNIQHLISNKLDPVHHDVSARSKPQVSLPVHKSWRNCPLLALAS